MKLQKLELEQQLQRNSEATSLQASQIQVQLAFVCFGTYKYSLTILVQFLPFNVSLCKLFNVSL